MTVEDELRDVDSMIRQPDEGLTLERRAADDLAKRGDEIRRLRELLAECNDAMREATWRYRTSWGIPGNSTEVAGWVGWQDGLQKKISVALNDGVLR